MVEESEAEENPLVVSVPIQDIDEEFWRLNSLPMSRRSFIENGNPSTTILDDTNVQVVISSDRVSSSTQSQKPSPGEATLNAELEECFLKQELCSHALQNLWQLARSIFEEFPDLVRIPLTDSGDTALHVAVSAKSTLFVKKLVELAHMTPEDMEILNAEGNTAFCMAAIAGNSELLQIMIKKNEKLPVVSGHDGMLPVHMATLGCYHETVQDLSSDRLLHYMDFKDIKRLFFMAISSYMYDVATKLVEKYPKPLSIARDDEENLTALHMLARKPLEEFYMQDNNYEEGSSRQGHQLRLLRKLWAQVRQLEYKNRLELIIEPSVVLFDAVKSGNVDVVKQLLYMNRELLIIKDPKNGQSLLHIAVLFRQNSIFDFILSMGNANLIIRAVDKDRNNVLHLAARQLEEASLNLRPDIRMRSEVAWFKGVEQRVPPELMTMRNKHGKTPNDMFYANHKRLSDEVKDTAKGVSNSGMVVATLIVAVSFAAALTTPGDKTNAWFTVFIMANAVALFTSSLSLVSFLSIFTSSRFRERDFIISLYPSLKIGKMLLLISVVTMVIAFAAASFLIFDRVHKWTAYVVASLGLFTIIMFLVLILYISGVTAN